MTLDEMIAVLQAAKEGKKIQFEEIGSSAFGWHDCLNKPGWDFSCYNYRVKPTEKKLVPHWPAVIKGSTGQLSIGTMLFASIDEATKETYGYAIRLATEYPPIMLEVTE